MQSNGVDAAPPYDEVSKAACSQLVAMGRRGDERRRGSRVEPTQHLIADGERKTDALMQILRELRVQRRRKTEPATHTQCARREPERSFGRDVNGIARSFVEEPSQSPDIDRDADLRITRQRQRAEEARVDDARLHAEPRELFDHIGERGDDAVGLRLPCVRDDDESHAFRVRLLHALSGSTSYSSRMSASNILISSAQCTTRNSPSDVSTSAVHDSTQSPQFM